MTLPPLVERELRVAARLRSTSQLRLVAALVASVLGGGLILLTQAGLPLFMGTSLGRGLFAALTWLAMAAALLSGPFLTSDALSIEKREGTLGFLFLTDLRGHDVVLGKLVASALRGGYALLAILPVLALTLMLGGLTGAHFWKTALALGNALLLSLSAGLFCSSFCREAQKALGLTFLLLVLVTAAGPLIDGSLSLGKGTPPKPLWSLSSPGYLFVKADALGMNSYWSSWIVNQLIVGALLALTCIRLPRTWQETGRTPRRGQFWNRNWSLGRREPEASLRRRRLDQNPILWVVQRERWLPRLCWLSVPVSTAVLAGYWLEGGPTSGFSLGVFGAIWSALSFALPLLAYLVIASQSCRFLGESRRSGLLELLLSTPLSHTGIVRGHWLGLLRSFGPPLALLLVVQLTGSTLASQRTQQQLSAAFATPPATGTNISAGVVTNTVSFRFSVGPTVATNSTSTGSPLPWLSNVPSFWTQLIGSLLLTVSVVANLAAVAWVGMWLGLTTRSVNIATLKTLLFVQVIPMFAFSFMVGLATPFVLVPLLIRGSGPPNASSMQNLMVWMPMIFGGVYGLLNLAKDAAYILWARVRLDVDFRDRAAFEISPLISPAPPVLASVPNAVRQESF